MSKLAVTLDDKTFYVETNSTDLTSSEWNIHVEDESVPVIIPGSDASLEIADQHAQRESREHDAPRMEWLIINDRPYEINCDSELNWIRSQGRTYRVRLRDCDAPVARPLSTDGRIKAPIPGQISRILVEPGQRVEAGNTVLILEAMKMENHILAPRGGFVSSLHVELGQSVMLNQVLAEITATKE